MSDLTLSKQEVRELTRTPIKARQVAFLHANGIRHYVDAHGWPVVLRSALAAGETKARQSRAPWTPNKAA